MSQEQMGFWTPIQSNNFIVFSGTQWGGGGEYRWGLKRVREAGGRMRREAGQRLSGEARGYIMCS